MILEALDEGGTAPVRLDPGSEARLDRYGLVELSGNFTQFDQQVDGFILACARLAPHRLIHLIPVLVLVCVDSVQVTLTGHLLLPALLAVQLHAHCLGQPVPGDATSA